MHKFELEKLTSYDDASMIAEIQRVAAIISTPCISIAAFDRLSKAHSTTLRNRFGGWRDVLTAAGLAHRYDDSNVRRTSEEVIAELQRVAGILCTQRLGRKEFDKHGKFKQKAVTTAFGSWQAALEAAGLAPRFIRDPSDQDCFENLLTVWTHYGRQPNFGEMKVAPSRITGKVYARKWQSWRKALHAFVQYAEHWETSGDLGEKSQSAEKESGLCDPPDSAPQGPRQIPVGLRYLALRRDRFRCVLCGASPATQLSCELQIDHVVPYSRGGPTVLENLRTLCAPCNLGKGSRLESVEH